MNKACIVACITVLSSSAFAAIDAHTPMALSPAAPAVPLVAIQSRPSIATGSHDGALNPDHVGFWKKVKKRIKKGITIPLNPPGGWKF